MLEKIIIFILFLGPLVFFHELGHYLFARLFGVRVEVFSIGFGPKILKFKKGFTEYALSIIPLGGYVKMFGDDPFAKDEIPEEERKHGFIYKGKWARFWIVFGGPLANFILTYFIFFGLFMAGEKIPEIKLGVIQETTSLHRMGFQSGDVIYKLNNKEIYNPTDIALEGENLITEVTVKRNESEVVIAVDLSGENFFKEILKYPPLLRKPVVVNENGEMFAVSFSEDSFNWKDSLAEMNNLKQENIVYLFPILGDIDPNTHPNIEKEKVLKVQINFNERSSFVKELTSKGYHSLDLKVKSVNEKSPAEKIGIKPGDIILSLEGKDVFSFDQLRKNLQEIKSEKVGIRILSDGKIKDLELIPEIKQMSGEEVKLIGIYSSGIYQGLNFIDTKSKGFFNSLYLSIGRTWETMVKTFDGFIKLISGGVSFKSIGGPLAIGKVASDSFHTSLSYFFQLMALISVNLGIINLFPIPVLDGGHIMFIFLEMLNRGPVSRRKMEIAQQIGLSFLLMLMVGAIFNDFSRFF